MMLDIQVRELKMFNPKVTLASKFQNEEILFCVGNASESLYQIWEDLRCNIFCNILNLKHSRYHPIIKS